MVPSGATAIPLGCERLMGEPEAVNAYPIWASATTVGAAVTCACIAGRTNSKVSGERRVRLSEGRWAVSIREFLKVFEAFISVAVPNGANVA